MMSLLTRISSAAMAAIFMTACQSAAAETCEVLTDFDSAAQNQYWRTINDVVMGGRSSGGPDFQDGKLRFSGVINTDGGGFSSLRAPLDDQRLLGITHLIIRAKTEGRTFNFTAEDNQWIRRMPIAHRASINTDGKWQDVRINLNALTPTYFGRKIDANPLTPKDATSIGFIISDGINGPFALNVDWIKICK